MDPEGVTGGPDPHGLSQAIWVSIGNKQFDTPPPPPKKKKKKKKNLKMLDPFCTYGNYCFL